MEEGPRSGRPPRPVYSPDTTRAPFQYYLGSTPGHLCLFPHPWLILGLPSVIVSPFSNASSGVGIKIGIEEV